MNSVTWNWKNKDNVVDVPGGWHDIQLTHSHSSDSGRVWAEIRLLLVLTFTLSGQKNLSKRQASRSVSWVYGLFSKTNAFATDVLRTYVDALCTCCKVLSCFRVRSQLDMSPFQCWESGEARCVCTVYSMVPLSTSCLPHFIWTKQFEV